LGDTGLTQLVLPLLAGVVAWSANEWRKRAADERQRKEERYRQLLSALSAFYVGVDDPAKKTAFFDEVTLCWLYCPDSVIRAAYEFLDKAQKGGGADEALIALNKLVVAMRRDLWSLWPLRRTQLLAADVKHYRVKPG
jgi:hypothetical protein